MKNQKKPIVGKGRAIRAIAKNARNNAHARVSMKLALTLDRDVITAFRAVCQKDGIGPAAGIETMMRWAAKNGSLFPVMKAEHSLAAPLKSIHRQLTDALRGVLVEADLCDGCWEEV